MGSGDFSMKALNASASSGVMRTVILSFMRSSFSRGYKAQGCENVESGRGNPGPAQRMIAAAPRMRPGKAPFFSCMMSAKPSLPGPRASGTGTRIAAPLAGSHIPTGWREVTM